MANVIKCDRCGEYSDKAAADATLKVSYSRRLHVDKKLDSVYGGGSDRQICGRCLSLLKKWFRFGCAPDDQT